jgi:GT2 family glycosyltransferase
MSKITNYIVVPNWNGAGMIARCLTSLENQSEIAKIIVVDNGSSDGSVSLIKKQFPNVLLLEFEDNAGFAGGVNRGIRHALEQGAEFIALFNNDAVADKSWLSHLVAEADEHTNAGIITGKLLLADKKYIDSTGDFYTTWGLPFPRGRNQKDNDQYDKSEEVFGGSGGASLYRADTLKQIGLFDEDFFAYFEDVDISFRAQMAGWKVRYTPRAVAYHDVGGTSSKLGDFARFHSAKNFLLLYARNMPLGLYLKYLVPFGLQFCRMMLTSIARKKFGVFLKGTWSAVKLHSKTTKVRKHNLSKQKVSNSYIDSVLTHSRPPRIPTL